MDVSIISPFYKGNKYLNQYLNMIESLVENSKYQIEIIIVNDSPEIPLIIDKTVQSKLNIKVIDNPKNLGIHASRINGFKVAQGNYILFLDQDDELFPDTINIYFKYITNYDVYVSNGYFETGSKKNLIFGNQKSGQYATKKKNFLWIRDFIVSPGHCLIKKEKIPIDWLTHPLSKNGTDDYLLWLLMFEEKARFIYIDETTYIHRDTGENLSSQDEKMFSSLQELLKCLEKCKYSKQDLKRLRTTINFKRKYKKNLFLQSLLHFSTFLYNVLYRITWKGFLVK